MNERNDIEFIQNKIRKRNSNINKRKRWRNCNDKAESSGKIKRQRWKENVGGSVTINVD